MTDSQKLDLILSKIGGLGHTVDDLQHKVGSLERKVGSLERIVTDMKPKVDKIDSLERGITEIRLTLENEIRTNIMRVAEGHLDLYRKFDAAAKIENEKEIIAIRVNILETELRQIKNRLDHIA